MSNKERIPVDADLEYFYRSNLPEWLGNSHDRDIGEYWIEELQAARAKDAELIQQLVDAVAIGNAWWYTDHPNDTVEGFENRQKLRDAIAAAEAAGFKPSER